MNRKDNLGGDIKVQLKEIMFEQVEWIELAYDRVQWLAILKMAVSRLIR